MQLRTTPEVPTESAADIVAGCARQAQRAAVVLASASDEAIDAALDAMAQRLTSSTAQVLAANSADIAAAEQSGMTQALIDRLRLGTTRLTEMADQLALLAEVPFPARDRVLEDRPD
ncbi:MAG: gamma-glutamyl phosphate reductase, partial [Pseudonocardiaceae bacterium]